jgi:DNA-binding transcriptional LysR family regulator
MLHITLRQLQVFSTVAQNLSYTRAAEALHLSQPGVSMQIKQLEDSIGLSLFDRLGKKIYLTPAGKDLQGYARQILETLDDASAALTAHQDLQSGQLTLAVATTANQFASRLVGDFSKRYENITLRLDVTNRERLIEQLENNEPDLVIMGEPPKDKGLQLDSVRLMENPLIMVCSPQHPLGNRAKLHLSDVTGERFVVREIGSGTRSAIERFFDSHGLKLTNTLEMGSNEAIKHAIAAGLGIGIISQHTAGLELETNTLLTLKAEGFPIIRHWHIVTRKGKRLSPAAEAFWDFLLSEAPNYVENDALDK